MEGGSGLAMRDYEVTRANDSENFPRGKGWLLVKAQELSKGEQTKTACLEAS